jgi:hypothetical protein
VPAGARSSWPRADHLAQYRSEGCGAYGATRRAPPNPDGLEPGNPDWGSCASARGNAGPGDWIPDYRRGEIRPTKTGTPTRPAKRQSTWHEEWKAWRPRPLSDPADRPYQVTKQASPPSIMVRGQTRSIASPPAPSPYPPSQKGPRTGFPQPRRGRLRCMSANLRVATRGNVSPPFVASIGSKAVRWVRIPHRRTSGTWRCPDAHTDTGCLARQSPWPRPVGTPVKSPLRTCNAQPAPIIGKSIEIRRVLVPGRNLSI